MPVSSQTISKLYVDFESSSVLLSSQLQKDKIINNNSDIYLTTPKSTHHPSNKKTPALIGACNGYYFITPTTTFWYAYIDT